MQLAGILGLSIVGCAAPPAELVIREIGRGRPLEEVLPELVLTATVCSASDRRDLLASDDPDQWIRTWWLQRDPSPGTAENEALDVFRQRAEYLSHRFADVPLSEVPEPWMSFLKNGHWDRILSGARFLSQQRYGRDRGAPARLRGVVLGYRPSDVLRYETPMAHDVVLQDGRVVEGAVEPIIPSLDAVWSVLEDGNSPRDIRRKALVDLSWYELPAVARRLLDIPGRVNADVRRDLDACFRRLAVRRAYALGEQGAQRLAAAAAAGLAPRLQLSRTLLPEYTAEQLRSDLDALLQEGGAEHRGGVRAPHPLLWSSPERLLDQLAGRYSGPGSVTGWDWRGDLSLAYGPPHHTIDEEHIVYYVHGYPAIYRVRSGVLGEIDATLDRDLVQRHLGALQEEARTRSAENRSISEEIRRVVPEASSVADSLLWQLHKLLPPLPRRMNYQNAAVALNIEADVVSFPNQDGSVELMVSLGIPYREANLQASLEGLQTRLETYCLLLEMPSQPLWDEWHDRGFTAQRPSGVTDDLYLVDAFTHAVDPGEYILYCSALEPQTGRSAGMIFILDLRTVEGGGPVLSPIALARQVEEQAEDEAFKRGDYRILPYPGRNLLYGEDIWIYFEINGLERSEFGDHAWEESYYFIPDQANTGIVRISPERLNSSLQSHVDRYIMIDLTQMESEYTGPLYILVVVVDAVSGRSGLTAARFKMFRR
jgi:hypothetical protein